LPDSIKESRRDKATMILEKFTISDNITNISYIDKILDLLASPYANDNGMYFKGRRYYSL
jgi:hypothetical protein